MNKIENNQMFSLSNLSTRYGLIGGLGTSLLLLIINIITDPPVPLSVFLKYLPMTIVVIVFLNIVSSNLSGPLFGVGAKVSFKMSLVAALSIAFVSLVIFALNPAWSFQSFGRDSHTLLQAAEVASMLFFEILVFTNLIAFITLQYLKR